MNYNIKINLLKLKGAEVRPLTTWNGNMMDYICIPIQNYYGTVQNASVGENGERKEFRGVYLNLEAIELREKERGSHILLPAISKERMASLTEEQLRKRPILGNLIPWGHKSRKNEGDE